MAGRLPNCDRRAAESLGVDILYSCRIYSRQMNYHNVYQSPDGTFFVLVCTRVGRYIDRGYTTIEEAAWQADRAKFVLNNHGLIGRLSSYNFPERLAAESESAWSVLPAPLVAFYCAMVDKSGPVNDADAIRLEEAKLLVESNAERQRLIDEESKKLRDEKNEIVKAHLDNLVARQRDILREFDALYLPKSIKDHNALAAALSVLHLRLTQLS